LFEFEIFAGWCGSGGGGSVSGVFLGDVFSGITFLGRDERLREGADFGDGILRRGLMRQAKKDSSGG
jgi:hypothetical protein